MQNKGPWTTVIVAAIVLFWVGFVLDLGWLQLLAKPLPVLAMALSLGGLSRDSFTQRLQLGLFLCGIADFIIELSFLGGLVVFLIAHLFYIGAFASEERALHPGRAILFGVWGVVVYWVLRPGLGKMSTAVAAYTLVICSMMWRAMSLLSRRRPWATVLFIGAVTFALSDTLIAFDRFYAPLYGARFAILSLYWIGQSCLSQAALQRAS